MNQGSNGRYLKLGVSNDGSGEVGVLSARAHYLIVNGARALVDYIDGNHFGSSGQLVRVEEDLDYVVKLDVLRLQYSLSATMKNVSG